MKVKIRNELDIDKPVNLKRLKPTMKIYAGIITKWRQTKFYQTAARNRAEAEYTRQVQRDENLKSLLLAQMYRELTNNTTLQSRGEVCQEIILEVNNDYRDSLDRILTHRDFIAYDISRVDENEDIRKAFNNMPILLRVSKKVL